jgi:uncharacterized OB-fold protein
MTSPVDERLFTSLEPLRLAGSSCEVCGTTTFPAQADCPRCARRTMADRELPDRGVLWTWTVQSFEPKPPFVGPPDGFVPFLVGYVDLGDVMVETRIDADPTELALGMPMRLVPLEIRATADTTALSYAFTPDTGSPA